MMRLKRLNIGFITLILTCTTLSSSVAFALPEQARAHAETVPTQASDHTSVGSSAQPQSSSNTHLEAAKLTACQNRETAIKSIITRIDTRAQNQLNLFSTIANRVETYYVSSGKTVSNYDQLTTAITTAKASAQTDLLAMQTNSSFSCSSSNPHGIVSAFQADLKTEINDLHSYRTTVKNLIVAVAKAHNVTVNDSSSATDSTNTNTSTSTDTQTGA